MGASQKGDELGNWNHSICNDCWARKEPNRDAVRLKEPMKERCCFCGKEHTSGIYVRMDPKVAPCAGVCGD